MFRHLRSKVILPFALLMIAAGAITTTIISRNLSQSLSASVDRSGYAFGRTLAAQLGTPIAYRDRLTVRRYLLDAKSANPDVVYVFVTSTDDTVTDHSFTHAGFPSDLVNVAKRSQPTTLRVEQGTVRDLPVPIADGALGSLHVGMSRAWVDASIAESVTNVLIVTGLAMIIGMAGIVFLISLIAASQLGQYTLEGRIGQGGMGVVYRAKHGMLRRPAAVKVLERAKAGDHGVERFEREVRLTAQLTHPNTVTVFDYGRTATGDFYCAMELLEGATLQAIVESTGPMPASRVVHVLLQVAGALEEAHHIGLIHRDIKPSNIMLCERGGAMDVAKVLDFGLVKHVAGDKDLSLTGTDEITGTPLYMSPESIHSPGEIGPQSDIYSLGAVGYYLLTGKHVFAGRTAMDVCAEHLHTEPTPPTKRVDVEIPPDLEHLVLDCLAKAPEQRPRSAANVAERLRSCRDVAVWLAVEAESWWQAHAARLKRPSRAMKGPISIQTVSSRAR